MNDYEILLMLDPDLPEERQEEIVKRTRDLVEKNGGAWDGQDAWGRRKLAYEINKKSDGVYHLISFSADGDTLDEIARVWDALEGSYQLCVSYEVSVVDIDSMLEAQAFTPVKVVMPEIGLIVG